MCVRTATVEQERAQQAGFAGVVTKPIDPADLKTKVCRTLSLETSYKYFHQRDGALVVSLPKEYNSEFEMAVASDLKNQLTNIVDAGGDKLIVDLSAVDEPTHLIIKVVLSIMQAAKDLSIRHAAVGSEKTCATCRIYEESQSWKFAPTVEKAAVLLQTDSSLSPATAATRSL